MIIFSIGPLPNWYTSRGLSATDKPITRGWGRSIVGVAGMGDGGTGVGDGGIGLGVSEGDLVGVTVDVEVNGVAVGPDNAP
jgi:hypothetical protein